MTFSVRTILALAAVLVLSAPLAGANYEASLKSGKADLKSAGVLAFGPDGILFVGDSMGGAVWAIATGDTKAGKGGKIDIPALNEKAAALLGTAPDQILVNDMLVNPVSKRLYISVSRGRGPDAAAVLLRTGEGGKLEEIDLASVKHARAELPNLPDASAKDRRGNLTRLEAITDLHYVDGRVFVAGLSNEEFASTLRAVPFPFQGSGTTTSVEIYHGQHGRFETQSPVRTFIPYTIQQQPHLLAAYTCTPLVKFPIADLKPNSKIVGTTIAELGNRNRPLDMITYKKGGQEYLLMSNSSRGVMKMSTKGLDGYKPITSQTEMEGVPYETIAHLKGVEQLDKLDESNAVILVRQESGSLDVQTIPLP